MPTIGPAARVCSGYSNAAFVYWPIALVLAYVAIAVFSLRQARERGVGTRVLPYVIVGIVIAIVVTAASVWAAHSPPLPPHPWYRFAGPAAGIGLGLLVLAWVDRSVALLAIAAGYLAMVVVPINFGWVAHHPSRWAFLPHLVISGGILLLAGIGFALAQRTTRPPRA